MIKDVDSPDAGPQVTQGDGAVGKLAGNLVRDVDADADAEPLQRVALPATLTENAGDLAVAHQHVVRPLERCARSGQCVGANAKYGFDDVGEHQANAQ